MQEVHSDISACAQYIDNCNESQDLYFNHVVTLSSQISYLLSHGQGLVGLSYLTRGKQGGRL